MANGLPGAGVLSAFSFRFEVIVDLGDRFPAGVQVLVMEPNGIAPLGRADVPAGSMLVVIPPDVADRLRAMKRAHEARQLKAGG